MGAVKWYKRDPNAALSGMMVLSLEERGAYNTILDLIYAHDDNLIDDDRFISGWLRCDVRVWRRIKSRLVELSKIELRDGLVTNFRATSEIDEALSTIASVSEVNRIKGIKSGIARSKNKDIAEPPVEPKTNITTPIPKPREEERSASTDEWAILERKLRQAAGWENEPHPSLCVVGPIVELIATGSSLELDVLPHIRAKASRVNSRSGWNYFIPGIQDATKTRLGIRNSMPPIDDEKWKSRLAAARRRKQWDVKWGPQPKQTGCLVPANLLEPTDGDGWASWEQGMEQAA